MGQPGRGGRKTARGLPRSLCGQVPHEGQQYCLYTRNGALAAAAETLRTMLRSFFCITQTFDGFDGTPRTKGHAVRGGHHEHPVSGRAGGGSVN